MKGQLSCLVGTGIQPNDLEVRLGHPQLVEGLGDGALREQLLGPGHEHVGRHPVLDRDLVTHGVMLPRAADTRWAA